MKKTIALMLAAALTFSLASCSDDDESSSRKKKKKNKADSSSSLVIDSSSQEETTTTTTTVTETTTTTTEETTTTTVTEPAKEYSIAAIVGDWYIDGDPNTAHLSIHEDGSFESYLASGSLEYKGKVTAGKYDLGGMNGEGEYFCLQKDNDPDFAIYIPYTDAQAVEFTTAGSASLHFLPKEEAFEMPENMPYDYSGAVSENSGVELHINADGSFEGLYIEYDLNDKQRRVEKFSHFAGQLGGVTVQPNGSAAIKIASVEAVSGRPGKGSVYINRLAQNAEDESAEFGTLGLAAGQQLNLYFQGTKYTDLPDIFVLAVKAAEEKDDMISDTYIWSTGAGIAFRAE